MKNRILNIVIVILLFTPQLIFSQKINEQLVRKNTKTRILFVFDASRSMTGRWQQSRKIDKARQIMYHVLDSLQNIPNLELALRVYGHQKPYPPKVCNDTRLEVPFADNNIQKIKAKLGNLNPRGSTPIAYSLSQAANDFPLCENCNNIIILITDGIEECDGDPCEASRELQQSGIVLKPFIIGIGRDFSEAFDCVGDYYTASREDDFNEALNVVIRQALNATSCQVNLIDEYGKPTATNVNMTFIDHHTGKIKYNFIHTLNNQGLPDTLVIDPAITYDIVINTIPSIKIKKAQLAMGKHTIIPTMVEKGSLYVQPATRMRADEDIICLIKESGSNEILYIMKADQTQQFLKGLYDIEILTTPRISLENIEIKPSHTTSIEIPKTGIAYLNKAVTGYGSLYVQENGEMHWLYDLNEQSTNESIQLLPGVYRVVFRPKYSDKSIYTIDKVFEIKPGLTSRVNMY
ncbi:MAG: VWA domain-containing protein [Bacteroidales bacterium]|nr:VWA domain-containing protein [Bacteroidales bacterium]